MSGEAKWAHSSRRGRERTQDGAVVLPVIASTGALSARRHDAPRASPGPAAPQTAREPFRQDKPPTRQLRARSADGPDVPSRHSAGPSAPARPLNRRAKLRQPGHYCTEQFLALLEAPGAGVLDPRTLAKLEAEAGSSRKQQEVVRLLRSLYDQFRKSPAKQSQEPGCHDVHQMAAQVAYLENKVLRLREKLKKKTRSTAQQVDVDNEDLDVTVATNEELETSIAALQAEKKTLQSVATARAKGGRRKMPDAEGMPERKDAEDLQRRAAKMQLEMVDLAASKEEADANAEVSRRLAETAKAKLQEMMTVRETERIHLEAEQQRLRQLIRDNERKLEEEPEGESGDDLKVSLQRLVENVEAELESLRKASVPLQATASETLASPLAPSPQMQSSDELSLGDGVGHQPGPLEFAKLQEERKTEAEALERVGLELEQARRENHSHLQQLEEKLEKATRDAENEEQRHLSDLRAQASRKCSELNDRAALTQERARTVQLARVEFEEFRHKLDAELHTERVRAERQRRLASSPNSPTQLYARRLHQQREERVRRQQSISGRFYLALRPRVYDRWEVMHYLCGALGVESDKFTVVEEAVIPQDTPIDLLVQVHGEVLPPPKEKMDAFIRSLPESQPRPAADAPLSPDADDTRPSACDPDGVGSPLAAEHSLIRLLIELTLPGDKGEAELVDGFVRMVETGGSLLEDIAVVGVCAIRGRAVFDMGDTVWCASKAQLVLSCAYVLSGRHCVMTGYAISNPPRLKLIAVDNANEEEFTLCFCESDLRSLFHDRDFSLGPEMLSALLDKLCILRCLDDRPVMVAILKAPAPATVLNRIPESSPATDTRKVDDESCSGSAKDAVNTNSPAGSIAPIVAEIHGFAPTACGELSLAPGNELRPRLERRPHDTGLLSFEDVLIFEDRFFLLSISEDEDTGDLRVKLQESGSCAALDALLPGRRHERDRRPAKQLRVFAQSHDFKDLILFLAVEDVAIPPGLVVRVARGGAAGWEPSTWRDPGQRVYWLGREGGPVFGAEDDGAGADVHVAMAPTEHRKWLLDFVQTQGSTPQMQGECRRTALPPQYGRDNTREGVVLRDSGAIQGAREVEACMVSARLAAIPEQVGGRLLLKQGKRLPAPGGVTLLCVVLIWEQMEPHLHFAVAAYAVGTVRSWAAIVDSLDIYRLLRERVGSDPQAAKERKTLARSLVERCEIVGTSLDRSRLGLTAAAFLQERSVPGIEHSVTGVQIHGNAATPAPSSASMQVLTQEEAAGYIADEQRFCMLRATRDLAKRPFCVWIFDEPDAPNAAFVLNNLLVVAQEFPEGELFSVRLQDEELTAMLLPQESHMLDPEHRSVLLQRLAECLDLAPVRGVPDVERLVVQAFSTVEEPLDLAPDETGTLCPVSSSRSADKKEDFGLKSSGESSRLVPKVQESFGSHLDCPDSAASTFMNEETTFDSETFRPRTATAKTSDVFIGGTVQLEPDMHCTPVGSELLFAHTQATLGSVDVDLTLHLDESKLAYMLKIRRLDSGMADTDSTVEVQIPAGGDPTRVYLEHRVFAGMPFLIAMSQQPFPHKVEAIVFNADAHKEASISIQDEQIVQLVERSARRLLCDLAERLLKFGSTAPSGSADYRQVRGGREMSPPDLVTRALQRHVPVISASISGTTQELGSKNTEDVLFSCSRYVVSHQFLEGYAPTLDAVEGLPLLTLTLTKKPYGQDFTLSIERIIGENHMIHKVCVRDKLMARPLGVYAEIHKVGDLRFMILFLDDHAPRALRVAIIEPVTGWSFQAVVVDSLAAPSGPPVFAPSSIRHESLQFFRQRLSIGGGPSAQVPPQVVQTSLRSQGAASNAQAHFGHEQTQAVCLRRETRFADDDEVVLLGAVAEVTPDGTLLLRCTLSQPASAKESKATLVSPCLDRLLAACGLPTPAELSAEHLEPQASRAQLGNMMLQAVEVLPSLELKFQLEQLLREPQPEETDDSPVLLTQCRPERMLGRLERKWEPPSAHTDLEDPILRVEIFDGSDCVDALFHTTNFQLRITDLSTSRFATRVFHEDDLGPWLAPAGAEHLLGASREADLVALLLQRACLVLPAKCASTWMVELEPLATELLAGGDLGHDFLESLEATLAAGGSPGICHSFGAVTEETSSTPAASGAQAPSSRPEPQVGAEAEVSQSPAQADSVVAVEPLPAEPPMAA